MTKLAGEATDGDERELKLRSYQQEMLDESLRRNVIVAVSELATGILCMRLMVIEDGHWEWQDAHRHRAHQGRARELRSLEGKLQQNLNAASLGVHSNGSSCGSCVPVWL